MNKQLSQNQIAEYLSPVAPETKTMTRYDKLMRLAKVLRETEGPVYIFHRLEYLDQHQLDRSAHPCSAFNLALRDPVLAQAGLKPDMLHCDQPYLTAGGAQRFFELSKDDLHEFSCDCGGAITNAGMAKRIERIAGTPPSMFSRIIDSSLWTG